jgi:hypothetical protein
MKIIHARRGNFLAALGSNAANLHQRQNPSQKFPAKNRRAEKGDLIFKLKIASVRGTLLA